jgi:hypothetical protein
MYSVMAIRISTERLKNWNTGSEEVKLAVGRACRWSVMFCFVVDGDNGIGFKTVVIYLRYINELRWHH